MADDLISRQAALDAVKFKTIDDGGVVDDCIMQVLAHARSKLDRLPAVDAVEVSAEELKFLINDTIAYIWRMEDSGRDKPEFGYDSRKALLEKLKQFGKEHFPEMACSYGERRKENAD